MDENLQDLISKAREKKLSSEDRLTQRRSFAYGNTKIENDRITRKIVNDAEKRLSGKDERE